MSPNPPNTTNDDVAAAAGAASGKATARSSQPWQQFTMNNNGKNFSSSSSSTTTPTSSLHNGGGKEIPPTIECGIRRNKNVILTSLVLLTGVYYGVIYWLENAGIHFSPADKYCPDDNNNSNNKCIRADLIAFTVVCAICIFYCAISGLRSWHVTKRVHTDMPKTPEGRLFGYLDESDRLTTINFTFQVWDFLISLFIPEHCTFEMMSHHVLAGLVCWCSLRYQLLHYYGIFFLGLSEVSSIFLLGIGMAKFFPPGQKCPFSSFLEFSRIAFAVTFVFYRILMWMKVSHQFWSDAVCTLRSGSAERYRPGRSHVLYVFLVSNFVLTLLQFYWLALIIKEVTKGL